MWSIWKERLDKLRSERALLEQVGEVRDGGDCGWDWEALKLGIMNEVAGFPSCATA